MNELRPFILGLAIAMFAVGIIIWLSPYDSQHEPIRMLEWLYR